MMLLKLYRREYNMFLPLQRIIVGAIVCHSHTPIFSVHGTSSEQRYVITVLPFRLTYAVDYLINRVFMLKPVFVIVY